MNYVGTGISFDEARAETQLLDTGVHDAHRADASADAMVDRFVAVIESRPFVREVIRRSMQSAFSWPVITYSMASELERQPIDASAEVVILSLIDASEEACASALKVLSELVPGVPIVVLATANDMDLALTALRHGAKGYIPCTMGFETAVQAVRFVLAGGTYAPVDCLLATSRPARPESLISPSCGVITSRERAVIHAIQQGKPNKIIAYELNMCESTVKGHVRNIMGKLKAKNRTEVAVRAQSHLMLVRGQNEKTAA
jgi:DNA-binding NarL/FixJ family response regulator